MLPCVVYYLIICLIETIMEWCCVNELQITDKIQKIHKTQSKQNNKPLLQMGFQLNLLSKTVLRIYELDLIYLAGVQ